MKNWGTLIFIIVLVMIALVTCVDDDETTSYYRDLNGNGREDFGEGVWYEDDDGIHFYD